MMCRPGFHASWLIASLLMTLPGTQAVGQDAASRTVKLKAPKSVVLLTIDTMRADAASFMGCPRKTTPFLDSMAARAVVFDRAYSTTSWTVPGVASMLTSLYPSAHGTLSGEIFGDKTKEVWKQTRLADELSTLAELFKAAGYRTIGVVANRHLQIGSGFEQGFDHYYDYAGFLSAEDLNKTVRQKMKQAFGPQWQQKWRQEKVFLWIHYFDPHHPYFPRKPWIEQYAPDFSKNPEAFPWRLSNSQINATFRSQRDHSMARRLTALYHSEISYTDDQVRIIFGELGVDDNTLVIFTSDHGEEIGEHGMIGHRWTLFEEVVQVPLFVWWPAVLPEGKRVGQGVSIVDILPTLAEMGAIAAPKRCQGQSLVPLLSGAAGRQDSHAYLELHPPNPSLRGLVTERWKLIRPIDSENRPLLFNLVIDPGEQKDNEPSQSQTAQQLNQQLAGWVKALPKAPETTYFSSQDKEEIEKLRALGYVDD
jgi:arylsulfatase A-like enzyme